MDSRRFTLFLVLSFALIYTWANLVLPRFAPPPPDPEAQQADADVAEDGKPAGEDPKQNEPAQLADANDDASKGDTPTDAADPNSDPQPAEAEPVEKKPAIVEQYPAKTIVIGSADPATGYFLQATITTRSAALELLELSDPRYRKLENRDEPLQLLGAESGAAWDSFSTSFEPLDRKLIASGARGSQSLNWEVLDVVADPELEGVNQAVTLGIKDPDGTVEVRKTFRVTRTPGSEDELVIARDSNSAGYQLVLELEVRNIGPDAIESSYVLQGPVGTLLENQENARKHRDFMIGVFDEDDGFESATMPAADVVESSEEKENEFWKDPLRYTGVDTQYFTVLIVPQEYQPADPYTAAIRPLLIKRHPDEEAWSEISLLIESRLKELNPGQSLKHTYQIFAGPKREVLLTELTQTRGDDGAGEPESVAISAEETLAYGWFGFVAKLMLLLLNFLHTQIGIPYGIAIICLTIIVRGGMFPLSRKQALSAQKMKDLQPKIAELKKKYANDKEKFARAQLELMSKHNYNPLAGCLPVFLQLPIFIGLYTALNSSVDLRMASFLYIDNLAAPDAIVKNIFGGQSIWLLGRDLNLLPLITIVLFIAQQKLFMPPPADEQQAQQQKMMNFMMIFFGVMFYRMPAGLCVYFIASSLWGIGERKLLDLQKKQADESGPTVEPARVPDREPKPARPNPSGSGGRKNRKKR